jgi:hypothetical protein
MADNKELQEAKKLLQEINLLRAKLDQKPLVLTDSEAVQQIQRLRNELKGAQKDFENIDDSATSLYDRVRAISDEFKGQKDIMQKVRGSMRNITSIAEQLKFAEQGISDLNNDQLSSLEQKLKYNKKILDDETAKLLNGDELKGLAAQELKDLKTFIQQQGGVNKLSDENRQYALEMVNHLKGLTVEQKAALSNYVDQGSALDEIQGHLEAQKQHNNEINRLMGVGGAVVAGVDALMSKLGMNSGIFKQKVEEANQAMKRQAELQKAGLASGGKLSVLMAGLGPLAEGFAAALFDPLSLILKIVDAFFQVDKASTDVQRLTGQNADAIAGANMRYATSVDYLNTISELTAQTGMNAQNIFTPDVIAGAAELKNTMGLAADEAGGLAMIAQTTGGDIDATVSSIVDQTSAFNKANRSAVNQKQVLQDVAKASDGIKASLGGNPKALANAASAARRLGMEMGKLDQIASSLLDFEDSISKEMEAELLIGKDLNLEKARELALNNDLAGLGDELFKNAADLNEFGNMNRIQQESYAAALGMTRDELGKIAYQKAIEAGMTEEQAEAAAGVRAEDMKRAEVQEQIQKSLDKLAQAFAPLLSIIGDIVSIFAPMVQFLGGVVGHVVKFLDTLGLIKPLVIGIVVALAGAKIANFFGSAASSAMKFGESLKGMNFSFSGMMDSVKSWGSSIKDAFKGGMSGAGKLTDTVKDKGAELTQDAAGRWRDAKGRFAKAPEAATAGVDKTVEASNAASEAEEPKSSGEKLKEFFTNLAAGLKEMASMQVVGGALALIPASVGLVAFAPGYLGAKLLERLDGEKVKTGLIGLATGLKEMASVEVLAGAGALIIASIGLVGFIPGFLGAKLLENLDGERVKTSLSGLAEGLTSMGTGSVLMGAGALVIAAGAFILSIVGIPGMLAIGSLGSSTATGLTALAGGLQSMSSTFAGVGALALTAGTFILMLGAIPGMLFVALTGSMVAAGLTALSTGLTAFGTAAANPMLWLGILALGAFGLAMIPLTFAISLLAPAIEAIGNVIMKVMAGIPPIITAVADGFVKLMGAISLDNIAAFFLLGPALASAAIGIAAFGIALTAASIGGGISSLLGGGILADLQTLVEMSGPLQTVAGSLTAIAAALGGIGSALATMETEKLQELQSLIMTAAFAAPAVAAVGAIGDMISGIAGGGGEDAAKAESNEKLIAKIDELIVAVKQGKNINMDGRRVGGTLQAAATNT